MDSPSGSPASRPPPRIPEHEVLFRIAKGNFGEVWFARNRHGTPRAVKVIHRNRFESDRAYERELSGLREFELVSREHVGLVDILQVGRNEAEQWTYCVMELADEAADESGQVRESESDQIKSNKQLLPPAPFPTRSPAPLYTPRTLASDLHQRERLSSAECISIGIALADALAFLHQRGLLHRDVKPSNIIFVEGVPKLADIGLVAAVGKAGSFVGTRGFIPPEGHLDARGDIFSLGKVLYECAWGRDRLEFPDVPTDAADWADHNQLVELNEVILKSSDPNPASRYSSAGEMRDELALLQHGKSLRRLRRLEKRWRVIVRWGVAAAVVLALAIAGNLIQQRHAQRLQMLVDENRDRLVQLQVANGVRLMEEGDLAVSALWFSEALKNAAGDPEREWVHRRRLQAVLERSPRLLAVGSHRGRIRAAQFSPDGRVFATAGVDGTVRTWNATNGVATGIILQHEKPVHDLQFSPDGRWLATAAEDNAARIWNVASGEMRFAPVRHPQSINSVRFSKNGQWLVTASEDHTAQIWNAANGEPIGHPFRHEGPVNDAEFSPQGELLATASDDDTARVWDVRAGMAIGSKLIHDHDVRSARFSPNGKRLVTASKDGTARIWDVATGEPITPPLQHSVPLWKAEFSPDGRTILAAGGDGDGGGTARIWDATTGEPSTPPMRHGNTIRSACFSPDGRWIVTASHDRTVSLWSAATGARMGSPFRDTHMMKWVSFSPDGRKLVTAGEDEVWKLWDVAGLLEYATPQREELPYRVAKYSPDGRVILGITANQTVVLLDAVTRQVKVTLGEHSAKVVCVDFSKDSQRVLTMSDDAEVRVWATTTGSMVGQPMKHGASGRSESRAEFSPDGRLIATLIGDREDRLVKVWDLHSGGLCIGELKHNYPAKALAFSPDGMTLLTGSGGGSEAFPGEARLWSTRTGQPLSAPMPHPGLVPLVIWRPQGDYFFTSCRIENSSQEPQSGRIWNQADGKSVVLPDRVATRFTTARFSPDGQFLATGADTGAIRLWHVKTGDPVTKAFGHQQACWNLEFSPDGRQLASSGVVPAVHIWEPSTGEPLRPALKLDVPFNTGVSSISFSPAGDSLLVSGGGHTTLWRLSTAELSVERLQELAKLAVGCRLDETGGLEPLDANTITSLLRQ